MNSPNTTPTKIPSPVPSAELPQEIYKHPDRFAILSREEWVHLLADANAGVLEAVDDLFDEPLR